MKKIGVQVHVKERLHPVVVTFDAEEFYATGYAVFTQMFADNAEHLQVTDTDDLTHLIRASLIDEITFEEIEVDDSEAD